jgi:post-segregation antitoxin (ccd killing protein)
MVLYTAIGRGVGMVDKKPREATSIKVDPDLWKEAKIEAIRRDMDLSDLVEDSLRKELKRPKA